VRRSLPAGDVSREALARAVDLFVLHYDVCGTSATTFRVLHDQRQVSVHFLLDVDGTVYQTLDLAAEAWHARQANPRSIGVEIAQIGAYPPAGSGVPEPLARWYGKDAGGTRITIPPEYGDGGVRTRGFVGRPARPGLQRGTVNGEALVQYDFTREQYRSLVALTAALARAFPKIELDAPRDPDGRVLTRALTDAELERFHGIVGHWHVSSDKLDPGPAFDWEGFLAAVRARVAADAGL
jgi:N-acetyl-anhydromuramyl-L-alanine amidase AmpD